MGKKQTLWGFICSFWRTVVNADPDFCFLCPQVWYAILALLLWLFFGPVKNVRQHGMAASTHELSNNIHATDPGTNLFFFPMLLIMNCS